MAFWAKISCLGTCHCAAVKAIVVEGDRLHQLGREQLYIQQCCIAVVCVGDVRLKKLLLAELYPAQLSAKQIHRLTPRSWQLNLMKCLCYISVMLI